MAEQKNGESAGPATPAPQPPQRRAAPPPGEPAQASGERSSNAGQAGGGASERDRAASGGRTRQYMIALRSQPGFPTRPTDALDQAFAAATPASEARVSNLR